MSDEEPSEGSAEHDREFDLAFLLLSCRTRRRVSRDTMPLAFSLRFGSTANSRRVR